jgi:hypothetical protein
MSRETQMHPGLLEHRSRELSGPVVRYTLTPQELAERYPTTTTTAGARTAEWRDNRRRNRARGLDRFGRPLPRTLGTNPRELGRNRRGNSDA